MNKVIILGRLGQDPQLKFLPGGSAVCNFSVATTEKWKDKEGVAQEKTEWHRIQVFGKLAELCNKYLTKGRQALIEGKLQTRSWDDKDGTKRYATEVVAQSVQFVNGGSQGQQNQAAPDTSAPGASFASDDIPF